MSGPAARSASSPCRPARIPDDLIRAGGRAALRGPARDAGIARRPALAPRARGRAADHARAARRPRHRLIDHVGAIQDPDVREQYRSRAAQRFNALTFPQPERRPWTPGSRAATGAPGRRPLPAPAAPDHGGSEALGRTGLSPELARAVLRPRLFPGPDRRACRGHRSLDVSEPTPPVCAN